MRIVQFGLCFSPNVGDGIIAECLAHAINQRIPGTEVVTVDLSGRQGFGAATVRNRSVALALLACLPSWLRQRLVEWLLGRMLDKAESGWRGAVEGAALAVVGGGQIFSDADLNFCLKIARAAKVIAAARVPAVVYAVGVSKNWTPRGRALFLDMAKTDLRLVSTRDLHSRESWIAQVPASAMPEPELILDPGLLAAACYGPPAPVLGGRIGLCVTSPQILAYHAEHKVAGAEGGEAGGMDFFARLAAELAGRGHKVGLFCNGAEEDRAVLNALTRHPALQAPIAVGQVAVLPAPDTPTDLARLVSGFSAVAAHRLHACIVAYSYGLPVVGLGWDRKVESFFEMIKATPCFIDAEAISSEAVADRIEAALAAGIDPAIHARVIGAAWDGIDRLLQAAGLAPAERTSPASWRCCMEGSSLDHPFPRLLQAILMLWGMPRAVKRLMQRTATAASTFWRSKARERRLGPISVL